MRHLIDTYIEAKDPRKISPFDDIGLLDLIVKTGIADAIAKKLGGIKESRGAVAETIENNVRSKIIQEHLNNPAYYEKMSVLLDEIIKFRKQNAEKYEEYLKRMALLVKQVDQGRTDETPSSLDTPAKRALYDNLSSDADKALAVYTAIMEARPANWRGNQAREQAVKRAIFAVVKSEEEVERIFPVVKAQSEF
jgi:type I restriction enzyme R subunit